VCANSRSDKHIDHLTSEPKLPVVVLYSPVSMSVLGVVSGSRFQAAGPACENERSPNVDRIVSDDDDDDDRRIFSSGGATL